MTHERETAEVGGKADLAGPTLKTADKLSSSRFDDVRVRRDGICAETTIPQPPPFCMGVAVEDLEVF